MLKTFFNENQPETPFNIKKKGEDAVLMYDTIQGLSQKNARMWQIIALVSLSSFFISLLIIFKAVNMPKTVPVIVTVNDEGQAEYVGKVDKSYWNNQKIPENAKLYQIKKLISNMYTWVIDEEAQKSYIRECSKITQKDAVPFLHNFFQSENPFDYLGLRTRTVNIQEPLRETDNSYVTYYEVVERQGGLVTKVTKFSALCTLEFYDGTPEDNPLGIYITSIDIKPIY